MRQAPCGRDLIADFRERGRGGSGDARDFEDEIGLASLDLRDLRFALFHLKCGRERRAENFRCRLVGAVNLAVCSQRLRRFDRDPALARDIGQCGAFVDPFFDLGGDIGERARALFFAHRIGDLAADLREWAGWRAVDGIDPHDMPAKRAARRNRDGPACRTEDRVGNRRRGVGSDFGTRHGFLLHCAETGFPCHSIQRSAALNALAQRIGGLLGRHDQLGVAARFARRVLRAVLLIARGDLVLGRLDLVGDRVVIECGVAHDTAFGPDEIGAVSLVKGLQLLAARRAFGREGRRGKKADRAFAPLAEQAGIAPRQGLRHHCPEGGRPGNLLSQKARTDVVAHLRIGKTLRGQRLTVGCFAEISVRPAEGPDSPDLAVDEVVACSEAIVPGEGGDHVTIDQLAQHFVETTLRDEFGHRNRRIFLTHSVQRVRGRAAEFGAVDPLVAHHRNAIAPGNPAEHARARHVGAGEGEGDQSQKGEGEPEADLGLEEAAEEGEHGCEKRPVGNGVRAQRDREECRALSMLRPCRNRCRRF